MMQYASAVLADWLRIARSAKDRFILNRPDRSLTPRLSSLLDMSRWLAAALVLVYHLRLNILVPEPAVSAAYRGVGQQILYLITDCGPQAVIWFFVTSGFLVGGGVVSDIQLRRFDIKRYFVNRVARLYVVLIPALILGYALDNVRVLHHGLSSAGDETFESYHLRTVLANVFCLQTIVAPPLGSNKPLWSLAYEAWYYVLFPLLLSPLWTRRRWGTWIGALASGAIIALLLRNSAIFGGFAIWIFGVIARHSPTPLVRSPRLAWLVAAALALIYPLLLPLIGSVAKLVTGLGFANAILTARFARDHTPLPGFALHASLASFSYSLYLVHVPALHFILTAIAMQQDPKLNLQPVGWEPATWSIVLFLALVFVAFLFSRVTELQTGKAREALWFLLHTRWRRSERLRREVT